MSRGGSDVHDNPDINAELVEGDLQSLQSLQSLQPLRRRRTTTRNPDAPGPICTGIKVELNMPALTLLTADTMSTSSSPASSRNDASQYTSHASATPQESTSLSPLRPPYSPISPMLSATHFDLNTPSQQQQQHQQQPLRTFAHAQPDATFIAPPAAPLETIDFDSNPDALAVKSAISILQIQQKKAIEDIRTLHQIKQTALQDPASFLTALKTGELKTDQDALFPAMDENYDDEDDDHNGGAREDGEKDAQGDTDMLNGAPSSGKTPVSFPPIPRAQKFVKTPAINWAQYGIIGPSLDKIHEDQLQKPPEGAPAQLSPDGHVVGGYATTESERREPPIQSPIKPGKSVTPVAKKPAKAGKGGKKRK